MHRNRWRLFQRARYRPLLVTRPRARRSLLSILIMVRKTSPTTFFNHTVKGRACAGAFLAHIHDSVELGLRFRPTGECFHAIPLNDGALDKDNSFSRWTTPSASRRSPHLNTPKHTVTVTQQHRSQFYSEWWQFGAPFRIKLRTLIVTRSTSGSGSPV